MIGGVASPIINPRRACAARITVVVLSFCLSVCLSFCLSVRLSVTTFSATTSNKTANKRYEWVQCHTGFILKIGFFAKMLRWKVMARNKVKKLICKLALAYLDQLCVYTLEAPEVAMQSKR